MQKDRTLHAFELIYVIIVDIAIYKSEYFKI